MRVRLQIGVVEHQLAAEGALHPSLRRLLRRIASLAASVLSLSAPEGPPTQDRAPSRRSSLRDRIVKLDRLLAALGQMSPSSRARLAPTLLSLHSLLSSLLRHRATVGSSSASHAGDRGGANLGCGCLLARPAGARLAEQAAASDTAGRHGTESWSAAGDAMIPSVHRVIRPVHRARPGRPASLQTPAAATPRPVHDATSVHGGAAGGAVATGAPGGAVAPATALAVSLLCALLSRLPRAGRTACRPRLLELRPERPG